MSPHTCFCDARSAARSVFAKTGVGVNPPPFGVTPKFGVRVNVKVYHGKKTNNKIGTIWGTRGHD